MPVSILLVFLNYFCAMSCYKIVAVLLCPLKSHFAVIDPLLVRLAELGHDVTVYNPFPKKDRILNYKEFDIGYCSPTPKNPWTMDVLSTMGSNTFGNIFMLFSLSPEFKYIVTCSPLLELFNFTEKFDLFVSESFQSDVALMYAAKLQTPLIVFTPNVMFPWLSSTMGNPNNPAYVPYLQSGLLAEMNFLERVKNTIFYIVSSLLYKHYASKIDDIAIRSVFESAPRIEDIRKNISLLFVASNSAIHSSIPLVPGVVDIGGIHIKPGKLLPKVSYGQVFSIL